MAKKKTKKPKVEEIEIEELDEEELEEALEELEEEDLEDLEEDEEEEEEELKLEDIIETRICNKCKKEFKCSGLYSKTQMERYDIEYDEVLCHLCALSFIDKTETKEEYEKSKKSKLEISSIKEKLKIIAYPDKKSTNQYSPELIKLAQEHLDLIKQLDYNYRMVEYFEDLSQYYGHNTLVIKKAIHTPLIFIKDYWEMYDKNIEEEKLRKQMLERVDKLDNSQLLELHSKVLKEICRGNTKKSIKEYLADSIVYYKLNLFQITKEDENNE